MIFKKIRTPIFLLSAALVAVILCSAFSSPSRAKATNDTFLSNVGTFKSVVTPGFSFKKDLRLGDVDPDVIELQRVLNADPDTVVATEGVGKKGKETSIFDSATQVAVIKFQNKYKNIVLTLNGITIADGLVNKATRTRLNLLLGDLITYDSVGFPTGQAGSTVASVSSDIMATTGNTMTTCEFLELMISAGVISSNKASQARNGAGCPAPQINSACQLVELLVSLNIILPSQARPARLAMGCAAGSNNLNTARTHSALASESGTSGANTSNSETSTGAGTGAMGDSGQVSSAGVSVSLKANGQSNIIRLDQPSNVALSWISSGANTCLFKNQSEPASGSRSIYATSTNVYDITCSGPSGSDSDSVLVYVNLFEQPVNSPAISIVQPISSGAGSNTATSGSGSAVASKAIPFIGSVVSIFPCLDDDDDPISGKFQINVIGMPLPGTFGIYSPSSFPSTPQLKPSFQTIGEGDGSGAKCKVSGSIPTGFKNVGNITKLGSSQY